MSIGDRGPQKSAYRHFNQPWLENKLQKILPKPGNEQSLDRIRNFIQPIQRTARDPNPKTTHYKTEKKVISWVLKKRQATARHLARIAGQCVAMAEVILPAKLLLPNVYRLIAHKMSWQKNIDSHHRSHQGLKLVGEGAAWLEWKTNSAKDNRCSNNYGCFNNRLGCLDTRSTRSVILDSTNEPKIFELQRTICSFDGPTCIQGSNYREVNSSCVGQYYHGGLFKPPGRLNSRIVKDSLCNLDICIRKHCVFVSSTPCRKKEHVSGLPVKVEPQVRMATSSQDLCVAQQTLGSSHSGSFCHNGKYSVATIQQPLRRSTDRGRRYISPEQQGGR